MESAAMDSLEENVFPARAGSPASEPGIPLSAVLSRMMGTLSLSSWQPPARALSSNRSSPGTASYSSPSYLAARRRVLKSYGIKESTTASPPPPSIADRAPYVATPLPAPPPRAGVRVFDPDSSDCDHTGGDGGNDFLVSTVPMGPSADVRSLGEHPHPGSPQEPNLSPRMKASPSQEVGRRLHGYKENDADELVPGVCPQSSPGSSTTPRTLRFAACSPRTQSARGLNGGVLKGASGSRDGARPTVKRLLVVDDSRTTRTLLRKTFARKGYVCDMACNGKVALAMMQNRWYDAVFMVRLAYCRTNSRTLVNAYSRFIKILPASQDVEMPVLNGYRCVQYLRSWERRTSRSVNQMICGLSCHDTPAEQELARVVGMDSFKSKPSRMADLVTFLSIMTAANAHRRRNMREGVPGECTLSPQQQTVRRLEQEVMAARRNTGEAPSPAHGSDSGLSGYLGEMSEGDVSDSVLEAANDSDFCLD
mmetsp:Transcript_98019/g.280426  ORF Transcript_98019/g.280426 Transcript_98019/m.280426 type:complete len:480 (+) Transcript_98019:64-1503(+)